MMFGENGTRVAKPCVVQVRVQRHQQTAPRAGLPSSFLVSIHEEASVITWQRSITIKPEVEQQLVDGVADLHTWSLGLGDSEERAKKSASDLGRRLRDNFLGDEGLAVLNHLSPTALLLEVDETILSLPWELLFDADDHLYAINVPTGRVVTTRNAPADRRDSLTDDAEITILVLAPAAKDLASVDGEVDAISALAGDLGGVRLKVEVLRGDQATVAGFAAAVKGRCVEIVHVAAHGRFDKKAGALRLGDGWFDAAQVAALEWDDPPYLVFGSACESARAAPGKRLLSRGRAEWPCIRIPCARHRGIPRAFLARRRHQRRAVLANLLRDAVQRAQRRSGRISSPLRREWRVRGAGRPHRGRRGVLRRFRHGRARRSRNG